ncbi:MAG TPA: cupin domain-containing protein [Candidatus Paceibacterota bacterium]
MNVDSLKKQLEGEGFKHIYEWKDKPETPYVKHRHQDKVTLYILDGAITFYIDGKTIELKKGDRFDVPPKKDHVALVGPEGCSYLVGEMIEGDS